MELQFMYDAGQKHSALILILTFIKLPLVVYIIVFFNFWVAVLHSFYCTQNK